MVPGDLCGPYCPRTVLFGGKEGVQMVETALAFWTRLICSVIFVNGTEKQGRLCEKIDASDTFNTTDRAVVQQLHEQIA